MSRELIENGVIIDETEGILEGLNEVSKTKISDLSVIYKFIREEKNTRFYIDDKLTCRMQDEKCCIYLWLDTGLLNEYGNPIFLSLLKNGDKYEGHYFGTADILARAVKTYFYRNAPTITKNLQSFKNKYKTKVEQRAHEHIYNENDYLLKMCNGTSNNGMMEQLISALEIEYPEIEEEICDVEEIAIVEEVKDKQKKWQKELTVGLLLEELEARQTYEEELLAKIEELSKKFKVQDESIEELRQKNVEYKQAMVKIRTFIGEDEKIREQKMLEAKETGKIGHALLGDKKILVLGGTELGENIMKGIAKTYGFENRDFDFETDYTKVVNYSGRIQNSSRYYAVIFGACPHKVSGLGDYSSIIEKFKQCEDQPYAADARSKSGELKMTKESFRSALINVCNYLQMAIA